MRYYYTDPLKAAWMAREFDLKITAPVATGEGTLKESIQPIPKYLWGRYIENQARGLNNFKYYIHPDCHDMLKPQVGDAVSRACRSEGVTHHVRLHWISNVSEEGELYAKNSDGTEQWIGFPQHWGIIQRNNKAFFTPEIEE